MGDIAVYPAPAAATANAVLGYASAAAAQNGIAVATDLTGCTVTVTVQPGRTIRITGMAPIKNTFAGMNQATFAIYEGAVQLAADYPITNTSGSNGEFAMTKAIYVGNPSPGSHTYKLVLSPVANGYNMIGGASILVEDITGGSGGPGPISLGFARQLSNSAAFSAETDVPDCSVTFVVPAGRVIKVTGHVSLSTTTVANDEWVLWVVVDGAHVMHDVKRNPNIGDSTALETSYVAVLSAGTHTIKLTSQRSVGTGTAVMNAASDRQGFIIIEDITGTPAPSPSPFLLPPVGRPGNVTIANTETSIISMPVPANWLRVGSVFRIKVMGLWTNTTTGTTSIVRVRFGTTTLTGNIAAGISIPIVTTARTDMPFSFDAMVTVLSIGAGGTVFGAVLPTLVNLTQPVLASPVTAAVVLDTTADKLIEMTFISGGASTSIKVLAATIVQEV